MHRAAASAKSHLPGHKPNAEKELKHYGADAGAKIDNAINTADKKLGEAKHNAEAMAKETKASVLQGIDKADRKIEEGASKAKGWFGSSK
jgi:F0F1-type ATP synthase membrane subunit b/b'